MDRRIENQQITETIPVHGLLSGASVGTWQADFPLTALDFEHIKNGKPVTFNWANSILLAAVGYGLNLLGKGASQLAGVQQHIYVGEWIAFFGAIGVSIILYLVGLALPNDRKKIMKEIETHFKSARKQRQVVKGEE